ncbi:hypothetical protein BV898_03591 [Hypsibius exemplaris]|uniref:Uncharacterized protein n=1 Tax=Hypsibius exemplaris TaxID=2072580 RepID=A0A1W0X4E2_HYPEX|nr:hypothetical protein BV898_03591 [Hypsibius exemplaris]
MELLSASTVGSATTALEEPPTGDAVQEDAELSGLEEDGASDSEAQEDDADPGNHFPDGASQSNAHQSSSPSAGNSLPVYVKIPSSSEQLTIAFFPMGTSNRLPGSKISAVTRNSVDGRIRCEIRDSTIQGREETTEGIPVDYHMVWESSGVPGNTYRDDYYAVKQNGKIFLTPAQTVHMRTVVEPKGTRQSESQRIGIVMQPGSREDQNAAAAAAQGKWIPYDLNLIPSDRPYRIEDTAIRHSNPAPAEDAANLESLIPLALGLKSASSSVAGSTLAGGMPRPIAGSDQLQQLFKKHRIHRTGKILELTGKPLEDTVRELHGCAYLVQGVWVGCGSLYFKQPVESSGRTATLPYEATFEYLLSYFVKDRIVDVTVARQALKLAQSTMNSLLQMMSKHIGGDRWKFQEEPDLVFIQENPAIVEQQTAAWTERRRAIDRLIEECEQQKKAVAADVAAPPARKVPAKRTAASASTPTAKRVAEELQQELRNEYQRGPSRGGGTSAGGMRGRGGGFGRGRGRGRGR